MKHFIIFAIAFAMFTSCSNEDLTMSQVEMTESEEYTISLGVSGEIIMDMSPLTKSDENNNLYGVQVYSKTASGSNSYTACAYGLFDNPSNMTITLMSGYLYKFVVTMVVDGKNIIKSYDEKYYDPFFTYPNGGFTSVGNLFIWSSSAFTGLGSGNSYLTNESSAYKRPFTDRYYGEYLDFSPTENGSVSIEMKRTAFGVKFIADGLSDGSLSIQMENSSAITMDSETLEVEEVVTFADISNCLTNDNYSEDIPVVVVWTKSDGVVVPLVDETLTFIRQQLHTVTIMVYESGVDSGVNISTEEGDLQEGTNTTLNSSADTI